jgi:uncharacterized protein YjaZ
MCGDLVTLLGGTVMSQMNLHILNAQKKLTAHCEWLQINLTDTYEQAKGYWHRTDYDHNAWFFGTGDLPRWLGYTAGFNLISRYLASSPHLKASMLANINAEELKGFI